MAAPIYIPTNSTQGFPFLHILTTNCYFLSFLFLIFLKCGIVDEQYKFQVYNIVVHNFYISCPARSQSVMSYTLRPTDCDPPGFSVPGMFQARILEWTAFSYSGGSSKAEIDLLHLLHLHWQAGSLPPMPAGKHKLYYSYLFFFFHYVACALGIIKLHFRHTEFEMPM